MRTTMTTHMMTTTHMVTTKMMTTTTKMTTTKKMMMTNSSERQASDLARLEGEGVRVTAAGGAASRRLEGTDVADGATVALGDRRRMMWTLAGPSRHSMRSCSRRTPSRFPAGPSQCRTSRTSSSAGAGPRDGLKAVRPISEAEAAVP